MSEKPEIAWSEEYPGYGVDRDGNVWSRKPSGKRKLAVKPRKLRSGRSYGGALRSDLRVDNQTVRVLTARLVLTAFDRPGEPDEMPDYKDGDQTNLKAENLRWKKKGGAAGPKTEVDERLKRDIRALAGKGYKAGWIAQKVKLPKAEIEKIIGDES